MLFRSAELPRFDLHMRIQHWGMMLSFILLVLTGWPLKAASVETNGGLLALFGGHAGAALVHRIAAGLWGVLEVREGRVWFVFDERRDGGRVVRAGERQVIPPEEPHHLEVVGPVRLAVEFHRIPTDDAYRMRPEALAEAIAEDRAAGWQPFCVVGTLGTTSSTSIDPAREIAAVCEREKLSRSAFTRWRREVKPESARSVEAFVELPMPRAALERWSLAAGELEL